MKEYWPMIIMIAISTVFALILILTKDGVYSSFGYATLIADGFALKLWAIDKYVLKGWDTIEEIKKNNTAAAIMLLAYAVILFAALFAGFVVFSK